jgi:hypothetical protein
MALFVLPPRLTALPRRNSSVASKRDGLFKRHWSWWNAPGLTRRGHCACVSAARCSRIHPTALPHGATDCRRTLFSPDSVPVGLSSAHYSHLPESRAADAAVTNPPGIDQGVVLSGLQTGGPNASPEARNQLSPQSTKWTSAPPRTILPTRPLPSARLLAYFQANRVRNTATLRRRLSGNTAGRRSDSPFIPQPTATVSIVSRSPSRPMPSA